MKGKKKLSGYQTKLEKILTFFQAPISNRIMDGYFIFTISHFLNYFDDLKSEVPIFGGVREKIDELFKKKVHLGFSIKGFSKQEKELFEGSGKLRRHFKIFSLDDIDDLKITKLLKIVGEKD